MPQGPCIPTAKRERIAERQRNETLTLVVFCVQMRMHLGRHSSPVKIVRLQPLPHQVPSTVSDETFQSRSYLQGRSPLLVTAKITKIRPELTTRLKLALTFCFSCSWRLLRR